MILGSDLLVVTKKVNVLCTQINDIDEIWQTSSSLHSTKKED